MRKSADFYSKNEFTDKGEAIKMKKLAEFLEEEVKAAFEKAGYDGSYAKVTLSNRPDLCEYQCNGAMALAKTYRKAPIMIANDVTAHLKESHVLKSVEAVADCLAAGILRGSGIEHECISAIGHCFFCGAEKHLFSAHSHMGTEDW